MSIGGRVALTLGVIAAIGCSEPPVPAPDPAPSTAPAGTAEKSEAETEPHVPAVFRAAYHGDSPFDTRVATRERIRAFSADDAVPHLICVAADGGWKWDNEAAIRDIASFEWDARPWIEDVVALSNAHPRLAYRALARMGARGIRKVVRAARAAPTSGHRASALDVLADSSLPEPELRQLGLSLLRSPAPDVARAAARLVVVQFVRTGGDARDVDRALRVSDQTRAETLFTLSRYGERAVRAAPVLLRRVRGDEWFEHWERMRAAEVLVAMESRRHDALHAFREALLREPEELLGLARMIAEIDPDAFVGGLTEGPVATRQAYAWCTHPGDVAPDLRPNVVNALVGALGDPDVRGVAALALARFEDVPDTAVEPLVAVVRDASMHARWRVSALHALARTGPEGRAALAHLVDDETLTLVLRERAAHLL